MALSREEKIRLLQGSQPSEGLTRDQKIALLHQHEASPDRLREDVSFAGSDAAGKTASGLFPRAAEAAAEGKSYGKQVLAAGNDLLSLPGRALASFGHKGDESYLNSMADEEGSTLVGRTLRDPGTGAALLTAPIGGAIGGLAKGAGFLARAGAAAASGAVEGAASAAAHQSENVIDGKDIDLGQFGKEVALNSALPVVGAGVGAGVKKSLELGGKVLKNSGEKMIISTIRPTLKDMKDGFRIQNVFKHGLEGSLDEAEQKLDSKFAELTSQLHQKLGASPEKVDMLDMLDDAAKSVTGDKAAQFGKNAHMEKAADALLNEIHEVAPNGVVDLATAQKLKRAVGKMGAWEWGKSDPEASARETLANALYSRLKKEIEDKAPEGVKEINQQLGELIPIERAVTRRIPVEARNSGISLSDMVAMGSGAGLGGVGEYFNESGIPGGRLLGGAALGLAASKLRKSPAVARMAYRLGDRLETTEPFGLEPFRFAARRAASTALFNGKAGQE